MKRKWQRFFGILLSFVLVLSMIPGMCMTVHAFDEVSEKISLVANRYANLRTISGTHYSVSCGYGCAKETGMTVNCYGALTIQARKGETITKVVLTYNWGNNKNTLSFSSGTFDGNATISGINEQNVTISSSSTAGVNISDVTVYFEGNRSNPTVELTGGANTKRSGGLSKQEYLPGDMDTVVYTAISGAFFEEFEPFSQNGVTVERTSDTVVTVSGKPTANTTITVPDAVSTSKIVTWDSSIVCSDDFSAEMYGNKSYSDEENGITFTMNGSGNFNFGIWKSYGSCECNFTLSTGKFLSIEIVAESIDSGANWTVDGNTLKWNGTPSNSVSLSGLFYLRGVSSINFLIEMPTNISQATVNLAEDHTVSSITIGGNTITDLSDFDITYGASDDNHTATTLPEEPGTYYAYVTPKSSNTEYSGTAKSSAIVVEAIHIHSFNYTASGSTITATCTADGCTLNPGSEGGDDHVATLTISAEDGIYDGTTVYGASITDESNIQGDATVNYYKANEDGSDKTGDKLSGAPTEAGTYWAEITLGTEDNSATAHVVYTIAPATLSDVSVTQNGALTYNGSAQTPEVTTAATAVNNQPVTFTFSSTQDGEYGDMPTVTNATEGVTFYYKATAPNHNEATGNFTVTVNKAGQTAPDAPVADDVTTNSITLKVIANGQYKMGDGDWTDSPEFTDLAVNTEYTFYQRLKEDENHTASESSSPATIRTNKELAVAATVTANHFTYDGTEKPLVTVDDSTLVGGEMRYALGDDATTAPDADLYSASIPANSEAGTYYVWYRVDPEENYDGVDPVCVEVVIKKADAPNVATGDASFEKKGVIPDVKGVDLDQLKDQMKEIAEEDETKLGKNERKDVTVTMETKAVTEKAVKVKEASAIKRLARCKTPITDLSSMRISYLNIKVEKNVKVFDVDKNGMSAEEAKLDDTTQLNTLSRVIDIPVKYDLTGVRNLQPVRYHAGKAEAYKKLNTKPTTLQDLTYYVEGSGADAIVHIYTKEISTNALVTSGNKCRIVYHLFCVLTGEHFYTTSYYERMSLLYRFGWIDAGIEWKYPSVPQKDKENTILNPVFWLFNSFTTDYYYMGAFKGNGPF
ncbi:MAG: hypothetical protein K5744_09760 [Eubacterium sp.]|nr:hypothetical protein [Eubacterium sp.]